MDRRQIAFILTQLVPRIREFPNEAIAELFSAPDTIERKYDLLPKPTEEELKAIKEGLAELDARRGIPAEEVWAKWDYLLKDYDRAAAGKADFEDAAGRVRKLSGEEQGDIADVIFAFLNECRYELGIGFWDYLGARLDVPGLPRNPTPAGTDSRQSTLALIAPGLAPVPMALQFV